MIKKFLCFLFLIQDFRFQNNFKIIFETFCFAKKIFHILFMGKHTE